MDVRTLLEHISGLKDSLHKYLEAKLSYYGLVAFEKAVRLLTVLLGNTLVFATLFIALLFLSGAAALYIGSLLESYELGLVIVGGFFLLLAIMLHFFRRRIFGYCIIRILRDVFLKDDDDEHAKS